MEDLNLNSKPFVSVCTPTYNRRPFIKTLIQCFTNQTYPLDRMELIIVDDGTDKIEDIIVKADVKQIKYFKYDSKMSIGSKRNLMHSHSMGSIIVYMDDDDYYPPQRVEHAVETLMSNPTYMCAGSSEMHMYYPLFDSIVQVGPYNQNHATAATFAFKRELLDTCRYLDANKGEESAFLHNFTIPLIQLDTKKTILVICHDTNTVDKYMLLTSRSKNIKNSRFRLEDFIDPSIPKNSKLYDFYKNQVLSDVKNYKKLLESII